LKKTTLLFSFLVVLFLGITYSQSVHAEENLLFEPDPKPADAHTEDQSVENLKKYLEMGYVQVDSLTNSYVKELINNGEITTQEAQTKIKVFTHPHYSSKDSLLNCDSSKNLSSSDFSIQACWGNPSAVIAVGPAVYPATGYSSEGGFTIWHNYNVYTRDGRSFVQPTFNQVRYFRGDQYYSVKNTNSNYQLHGTWFCDEETFHPIENYYEYHGTISWQSTHDSYYYTWGPTDFTFPTNHEPVYKLASVTYARWYGKWYRNGIYQFSATARHTF
jgi:hypothetical protein